MEIITRLDHHLEFVRLILDMDKDGFTVAIESITSALNDWIAKVDLRNPDRVRLFLERRLVAFDALQRLKPHLDGGEASNSTAEEQ